MKNLSADTPLKRHDDAGKKLADRHRYRYEGELRKLAALLRVARM
jgi:hypothetical protein